MNCNNELQLLHKPTNETNKHLHRECSLMRSDRVNENENERCRVNENERCDRVNENERCRVSK